MNAFLTVFGAMITVFFAALGAAFRKGRGWRYVNIVGDRERYDREKVLKFIGLVMWAFAVCCGGLWMLAGLFENLEIFLRRTYHTIVICCLYTGVHEHRRQIPQKINTGDEVPLGREAGTAVWLISFCAACAKRGESAFLYF